MQKKLNYRTRILILFLIMAVHYTAHHLIKTVHVERTAGDVNTIEMPSKSPFGNYKLIQGTQGCPSLVRWADKNSCKGFTLSHQQTTKIRHEDFCQDPQKSAHAHVTKSENVIQKRSWQQRQEILGSSAVAIEDTLILGEPGSFLWEHSRAGKGFSCLYSLAKN